MDCSRSPTRSMVCRMRMAKVYTPPMLHRGGLVVLCVCLSAGAGDAGASAADAPWDVGEPFTADPAAMLAAAKAVPVAGDPSLVLLSVTERHTYDAAGRASYRVREVFRILRD